MHSGGVLKFADALDETGSERLTSNQQLLCKLKGEKHTAVEWDFNRTVADPPELE